jgi:predicted RNase H-like nuclease
MTITIIGIDCAVDQKNVGVAIGSYTGGICNLLPLPNKVKACSVSEFIHNNINRSTKVLLALDAPLGWPVTMGYSLINHMAGAGIETDSNLFFRRATDRFVKTRFGKQPLDVGADRIARTAKAALDLLAQIRGQTNLPIPLVWEPVFKERVGAIEVYPAGTLVSYGLPSSGYKNKEQIELRKTILGGLQHHIGLGVDLESAEMNADVLDAIICVLAGTDFLRGQTDSPPDPDQAAREGWIWIKRK